LKRDSGNLDYVSLLQFENASQHGVQPTCSASLRKRLTPPLDVTLENFGDTGRPHGSSLGTEDMRSALRWSDLEIEKELGAGHAGVVLRARLRRPAAGLQVGDDVAVKRYKSWVLEEPGQFERIFRELETGRKITHSNLVRTLGVVADDLGRPALVMKHYDGEPLQAFLQRHRTPELYTGM